MGEMFGRAFTEQRLLDAWDEARQAALADGDAGPGVERFEAAAARNVSELAEQLASGTYAPQSVHRRALPTCQRRQRSHASLNAGRS